MSDPTDVEALARKLAEAGDLGEFFPEGSIVLRQVADWILARYVARPDPTRPTSDRVAPIIGKVLAARENDWRSLALSSAEFRDVVNELTDLTAERDELRRRIAILTAGEPQEFAVNGAAFSAAIDPDGMLRVTWLGGNRPAVLRDTDPGPIATQANRLLARMEAAKGEVTVPLRDAGLWPNAGLRVVGPSSDAALEELHERIDALERRLDDHVGLCGERSA